MSCVTPEAILEAYLKFFLEAWKKGYKIYWIFHRMEEQYGLSHDALQTLAQANGFPLFPSNEAEFIPPMTCPYFVRSYVSEKFSDWLFAAMPNEEKFISVVTKSAQALKMKTKRAEKSRRESGKLMRSKMRDARDAFGGGVVDLKPCQLLYNSCGRATGRNSPSGFGVKRTRK